MLAQARHDVTHVNDIALGRHPDQDALNAAQADSRVLVSSDTHFSELLARADTTESSLVLFRQGNRAPEQEATTLIANLPDITDDLDAGAITVFTNDSIRIRRPPVPSATD